MPTVIKFEAPAAIQTYLSAELNSLADGANKLGAKIDNGADGENAQFINLELYIAAQGAARDAGGHVSVYLLPSVDDVNFCYGDDSTDPPASALLGVFLLDAATAARRVTLTNLLIPPLDFKLLVQNNSGEALAASANTFKYRLHSQESQ